MTDGSDSDGDGMSIPDTNAVPVSGESVEVAEPVETAEPAAEPPAAPVPRSMPEEPAKVAKAMPIIAGD